MTLYKQELNPEETLRIIFCYVGQIAKEHDLDQLLILMANMGRDLIVADRCTLWLIDKKRNELISEGSTWCR